MKSKTHYTNEKLQKKCKNNFELAKFAIGLAKEHMRKGDPKSLRDIVLELESMPPLDDSSETVLV